MFATARTPFEMHFLALLLCLVIVVASCRLVGIAFRAIKLPVVIGEILVGIALGPSLLGQISPRLQSYLFSASDVPIFKIVAELGLVLFMFVVGMEVDLDVIRKSGRRAVIVSLTSIALPFALGFGLLGHFLYQDHKCVAVEATATAAASNCSSPEVTTKIAVRTAAITKATAAHADAPKAIRGQTTPFSSFALFIGVSMSITAFPVLARILAERNMFRIPLGLLLIACAAIDDIMAFTLLALSTAVAGNEGASSVIFILLKLAAFVVVLFTVVRPLLERFVVKPYRANGNRLGAEQLSILLVGLLLCSYMTSQIGVHDLIGAFLFGVVVPRRDAANMFHAIADRLEGVSVLLLLPVFFVIAGQGVNLQGLTTHDILPALAIIVVAITGKFVGGTTAARLTGVPRRQSLAVGTLMNTRGLAELVILGVGKDLGVIDDKLYTLLVIMALVTTGMAGPLLKLLYPDRWLNRDIAEADRKRQSSATDHVALIVGSPADARPLAEAAAAYGGGRATGSVTLVRFTDQGAGLAGFADDLGEMKALRETIERAGLTCQVVSRASKDRRADIISEVERIAPGAVILGPSDIDLTDALRHVGPDVIMVSEDINEMSAVHVHSSGSNSDQAAVEMGVRMALHAHVPLVIDGGVSGRAARQMRSLGVDRSEPGPSELPVITVGSTANSTVIVRPGERDRVPLTEALEGWSTPQAPIILNTH